MTATNAAEKIIGVLLMAYGGPNSLEDIPAYLLDVRGGRPTSQEIIDEITENYRRIGGKSPILELTQAQADAVQKHLNDEAPDGIQYKVYIGMRHWTPWIKDTVAQMMEDGITEAVTLVLAPHYSSMSIARYYDKLDEALAEYDNPFQTHRIESYHNHPLLVEAIAKRASDKLQNMPEDTHVIFSAHSLPVRIIKAGDPYEKQLKETAALVAQKLDLKDEQWSFCFQSEGKSPEPWLGPDICVHINDLADKGVQNFLSVVIGFVCDHVEILFDIDLEAAAVAEKRGVHLDRALSLNDDPIFISALVDIIRQKEGTPA